MRRFVVSVLIAIFIASYGMAASLKWFTKDDFFMDSYKLSVVNETSTEIVYELKRPMMLYDCYKYEVEENSFISYPFMPEKTGYAKYIKVFKIPRTVIFYE